MAGLGPLQDTQCRLNALLNVPWILRLPIPQDLAGQAPKLLDLTGSRITIFELAKPRLDSHHSNCFGREWIELYPLWLCQFIPTGHKVLKVSVALLRRLRLAIG